ncbi:MAG: zinc ribbon domain-containing protein [Anaerolineae bacterium]|nr:zinc ribbon domain-containing protein [Anaerolineae bacterium]
MPSYDFRCKECGTEFDVFYKSYAEYDAGTPQCPNCASTDLDRIIRRVSVQSGDHDYTRMSSKEMLNVMESGDSRQVDKMFRDVAGGGADPRAAQSLHEHASQQKKPVDKKKSTS